MSDQDICGFFIGPASNTARCKRCNLTWFDHLAQQRIANKMTPALIVIPSSGENITDPPPHFVVEAADPPTEQQSFFDAV